MNIAEVVAKMNVYLLNAADVCRCKDWIYRLF